MTATKRVRKAPAPSRAVQHSPASTGTVAPSVYRLGFWAAIWSALLSAAYVVSLFVQPLLPEWEGAAAYAAGFAPLHQLALYPSIVLAPVYLLLLVALHIWAPAEKKVWSLSALAIGLIYAAMASVNYNIQLVAVRRSLLAGETEGLAMFLMANPNSIVPALANSYVYMALSMLLAAFVFGRDGVARWIRWLLIVAGVAAPLQMAWSLFDLSTTVLALSLLPWAIGALGAFPLIAVLLRRTQPYRSG